MALTEGIFPYDVTNLATGPVRVMFAPATETEPDALNDLFDQTGPTYSANGGWEDIGATEGATTYNRNLATQDLTIEQSTAVILEEITGLERTLTVPAAEVRPDLLAIFEAASSAATTPAAAANLGSATKQLIGTVTSLPRYRVAFIVMRDQSAGVVNEPGGRTRGRFFAFVGFSAQISAENASMQLARNALATVPLTFRFFPVDGKTQGEEHGFYIDENAQTISGT